MLLNLLESLKLNIQFHLRCKERKNCTNAAKWIEKETKTMKNEQHPIGRASKNFLLNEIFYTVLQTTCLWKYQYTPLMHICIKTPVQVNDAR